MTHYAIIKRQRYWIKPEWHCHLGGSYGVNLDNIKYESKISEYPYTTDYENIIVNTKERGLLIDYWEGNIHQEILDVGEKLVFNDETFTIKKVEKHVDGKVTYQVDDLCKKVDDYDLLLSKCEMRFEENKKKEIQKFEISPQVEKYKTKKSWIKRLFG